MLNQRGAITFGEISQQKDAWKETIKILTERSKELTEWFSKEAFSQVVFTGAGSSFHAAGVCANFFMNVTGVPSTYFSTEDCMASPRLPFDERRKTLVIVLSRSGNTTASQALCAKLKTSHPNTRTLLITPNGEGTINQYVTQKIWIPKAAEKAPVSTKAYTTLIFAVKMLTAVLIKNKPLFAELSELPEKLVIKKFNNIIQRIVGTKPIHIAVVGNGIYYPHAMEGSSLIKKIASVSSEYNYATELSHGDANHMHQNMMTIILAGDSMKKSFGSILGEISQTKSQSVVIAEKGDNKLGLADYLIELNSGLGEYTRDLLMIPVIQELAFYLAFSKAYNPDKPKHVKFEVVTKE